MLPHRTREHVLLALRTTPAVLKRLIAGFASSAPVWDHQVEGRFTSREHVAHLADWEEVFFQRIRWTLDRDRPAVPNPDETAMANDRGFSRSDPHEQADIFAARREALADLLSVLSDGQWDRVGIHPKNGEMTIEAQAVHVLGHDGYHLDYLTKYLG